MTIEDETGIANLVVWRKVFLAFRPIVMGAPMIGVKGYVQREGEVVHPRRAAPHRSLGGFFDHRPARRRVGQEEAGAAQAIRVKSRDFH